jgi:hypothetical protein
MLHAGKLVENRRWNTSFRGTFLLHAAKSWDAEAFDTIAYVARVNGVSLPSPLPGRKAIASGGIVGRARLVGVLPPTGTLLDSNTLDAGRAECRRRGLSVPDSTLRWHFGDQFGFVLADVEPLPFVALRGALGFFEVDTSLFEGGVSP